MLISELKIVCHMGLFDPLHHLIFWAALKIVKIFVLKPQITRIR